jgi:hypothetical protein
MGVGAMRDSKLKLMDLLDSPTTSDTGMCGGLEHQKIETRLRGAGLRV